MIQPRVWAARLSGLFFRRRREAELAEEVRSHLEMQLEDNLRAGMSPDEARGAALRSFGGVDQMKEEYRDRRGLPAVEAVGRDLRQAARMLRRSPGFTAVALATLALGIGAVTAVFSIVNAVLLRSLTVPNPQELRVLQWTGADSRLPSLAERPIDDGKRLIAHSVSHPIFSLLREQGAAQAEIFGFIAIEEAAVRAGDDVFAADGMMVSDNFFAGLGVRPLLGRLLSAGDDDPGSTPAVVIAYGWWERHLGRDPAVLERAITLNGVRVDVIGVLPADFAGVLPGEPRDFYVSMSSRAQFFKEPFQTFSSNRHWWIRLMARLKPGSTDAQLAATLTGAFTGSAAEFMDEPRILVQPGRAGLALDRKNYAKALLLMLGVVGLVMLVACANLAGLSLARGAAREHELAVRAGLGAGRWPLVRQSLVESMLLAVTGGALGVLLAVWGKAVISRLLAGSPDGLHYDLSLDRSVLGFSFGLSLLTALLTGILPALRAGRVDPLRGMRSRGALGASPLRVGKGLVAAQIGLSLSLLAGAGLYLRTLANLEGIDPGFRTDNLLVFEVNPAGLGYEPAQVMAFHERLQDAVAALPGVEGASFVQYPLLDNKHWRVWFSLPGHPPRPPGELQTHRLVVGEAFFATMGIPILEGRALNASDTGQSAKVVVVNETFARRHLPGGSPLGQVVKIFGVDWQIVGVSGDTRYENVKAPVPEAVYNSFRQYPVRASGCVAVRTLLPPRALSAAVRKAVAVLDPAIPVARLTTEEELRSANVSQERLLARLCAVLAGLGLLLSCIGLYGLMAYQVSRRTSEIAVRMAIGARPRDVARSILGQALLLATFGIIIGLPGMMAAGWLVRSQLFGVEPHDPAILASAAAALVTAALLGAWVPAWRATRISPLTAIRSE